MKTSIFANPHTPRYELKLYRIVFTAISLILVVNLPLKAQSAVQWVNRHFPYTGDVYDMEVDGNGNLWAISPNKLMRWNEGDGSFVEYTSSNSGLPASNLNCLSIDAHGQLWLGTIGAGVAGFNPGTATWVYYTTSNSNIASNIVYDVVMDASDELWVATTQGLSYYDGNVWGTHLATESIWCLAVKDDKVFVGRGFYGMAVWDGVSWAYYYTGNSAIPGDNVKCIIGADTGVWVGTAKGLGKFDGTTWTTYNMSNTALPSNAIGALYLDDQQRLWIGAGVFGVTVLTSTDSSWTYDSQTSGLWYNTVRDIIGYPSGKIMIATQAGITFYGEVSSVSYPYTHGFDQDFLKSGWSAFATSTSNLAPFWVWSNSSTAGGTAPEAVMLNATGTGQEHLISPPINTSGLMRLMITFRHTITQISSPYSNAVKTSADGANWTDVKTDWYGGANQMLDTLIVQNSDVGSETFQVQWEFDGNISTMSWAVDDVTVDLVPVGMETEEESGHRIYPNPAANSLLLRMPNTGKVGAIQLFDILGNRVYAKLNVTGDLTIDLSRLSNGLYLIQFQEGNSIHTERLIISR